MHQDEVELLPVDELVLGQLLAVAIRDATPEEVMAPVAGAPGWTTTRRAAFTAYHRSRRRFLDQPLEEITFAVTCNKRVIGAVRLATDRDPFTLEVGLWLGRSSRGQGIGSAVLALAVVRARQLGARLLIARTTAMNEAAQRVLASQGFASSRHGDAAIDGVLSL